MKKLIAIFMLVVLSIAMAAPAMAVNKTFAFEQNLADLTEGWTGFVEIMEGHDEWWKADADDSIETYYYGAMALNQAFIFNETASSPYIKNMKLGVFNINGASHFNGYRLWFNYSDFDAQPGDDLMVYYGRFKPDYVHPTTNYKYWEAVPVSPTIADPGSINGDFYVDVPESDLIFPILVASKPAGGSGVQPGNPNGPTDDVPVTIPKTGDGATPMLWICMIILSGTGMLMLRKRRHG